LKWNKLKEKIIFNLIRLVVIGGIFSLLIIFNKSSKLIDIATFNYPERTKSTTQENISVTGQVAKIFDGDTFSVRLKGKIKKIRLIGIDAPETGAKYTSAECFHQEATDQAIRLLKNQTIQLVNDFTQQNEDKYGRLLRYVFLADGTFFNQLMIEQGFAREYTYQHNPYQYQKEFIEAERRAKKNKRGLWGHCNKP